MGLDSENEIGLKYSLEAKNMSNSKIVVIK